MFHILKHTQVNVFWIVTMCNVVGWYQLFGRPYCLCLQSEVPHTLRRTFKLTSLIVLAYSEFKWCGKEVCILEGCY